MWWKCFRKRRYNKVGSMVWYRLAEGTLWKQRRNQQGNWKLSDKMFWKEPSICWKENMSCLADRPQVIVLRLDQWI